MKYRFCPKCGSPLQMQSHGEEQVPTCTSSSCGFVFWQNSKPCVSILIPNEHNHILMGIRNVEPDKGKVDLPGGFLKENEHPFDGAKREIQEELGVSIKLIDIVGFITDSYGDTGDYTLNIGIHAEIFEGTPKAADDVADLVWVDPANVDVSTLAFSNNEKFLMMWTEHVCRP